MEIVLSKTSHTNSIEEKTRKSWGGESFSSRILIGKLLGQLDAEGVQPRWVHAASRQESLQGLHRKDLCYVKPVNQTLGNLEIFSVWTQRCELTPSMFWHKCLNIAPIRMNHGFVEGGAGEVMMIPNPVFTCLCSTAVSKKPDWTLSFAKAERPHPLLCFLSMWVCHCSDVVERLMGYGSAQGWESGLQCADGEF